MTSPARPGTAWLTVEGAYTLPDGTHVVVHSASSTGSVVLVGDRILIRASFGDTIVLTVQSLSAGAGPTLAWIAQDPLDGRLVLDVWDINWTLHESECHGLTAVEALNSDDVLGFISLLTRLPIRRRGRLAQAATIPSVWTGRRDHQGDAQLHAVMLSYGRVLSWHPTGTARPSPTPAGALSRQWWTTDGLHRLASGFEVDVRSNGPDDAALHLDRGLVVYVEASAKAVDGLLLLLSRTVRGQSGASEIESVVSYRPENRSAPLIIDDLSQDEDSHFSSFRVHAAAAFDTEIAAADLTSYLTALSMLPMIPDPFAEPAADVASGDVQVGPVWRGYLNADRQAIIVQTLQFDHRPGAELPAVAHVVVDDLRVGPSEPTAVVALNNTAVLTVFEHADELLLKLSRPDPVSSVLMPAAVTYHDDELVIKSLPLGAGHIGCDRCNDHLAPQFVTSTEQHLLYQYVSALESMPVQPGPAPDLPGDEYPAVWRGSTTVEGAARIVQVRYHECPPDSAIPTFAEVLLRRPFAAATITALHGPPAPIPPAPWYLRPGPLPRHIADGAITTFHTAAGPRTGIVFASSLRLAVEVHREPDYPNATSFDVAFHSLAPIVGPKVIQVVEDPTTEWRSLAVWDIPSVPAGLPHGATATLANEAEFESFVREVGALAIMRGATIEANQTITYWAGTSDDTDDDSPGAGWVTIDSAGREIARRPADSVWDVHDESYPAGALPRWTPLAGGFGVRVSKTAREFGELVDIGRRMAIGRRSGPRPGEKFTSLVEVDDFGRPCANLTVEFHSGTTPFTLRRARHRDEEFHTSAVWAGSDDFTALMLMTPTVVSDEGYPTHAVWRGVMTENVEAVVERLDSVGGRPDVVAAVPVRDWRRPDLR